jgi:plastocyanin
MTPRAGERSIVHRRLLGILCLAMVAGAACSVDSGEREGGQGTSATRAASRYVPRVREVAITTVPLLVKEQQGTFPFLKEDFAKDGVLEGKEVYAFSPSTVTVVEGDTIRFTLINPEDDVHSFVLPDLAVSLPGQKITSATYVARHAGVFPFVCAIQAHLPMMSGQLVVLAASSVTGGGVDAP